MVTLASLVLGTGVVEANPATPSGAQEFTMPNAPGTYMDWMKTVYSRQSGESLVQEPIMSLNADGSVSGAAAQSWSVSSDKLTWTFKLRHLKWSNGQPLTANDFVYGFQHAADPKTAYDFGWFWGGVVQIKNWNDVAAGKLKVDQLGVSAPDPYTLKVTTATPCPFLLNAMIYSFPEPKSQVQKYGDAWSTNASSMIFSGPYQVQQWIPHQKIIFTPNPSYTGVRHHYLTKVTFDLVPQTDYSGFQTNQVDWTVLDPGQLRAAAAGQHPGSKLVTIQDYWINMLGFNVKVKPLDNPLVRKAFSLAIDKSTLVNNVLKGLAAPDASVVPKGFPGYEPSIQEPYNVKEAQQLLAKAGYPGGKGFPTLTLQIRTEPVTIVTTRPAAEYIQAQLQQNLGIHINIKELDQPTWVANVSSGKAQLFIRPYNYDYVDPSNWYSLFLPGNVMTWKNPQYNKLVQQANSVFDPKLRASLYHKAAQILNSDTGAVFLWLNVQGYMVRDDVQNFPTTPAITVNSDWITNVYMKH